MLMLLKQDSSPAHWTMGTLSSQEFHLPRGEDDFSLPRAPQKSNAENPPALNFVLKRNE